MPNGGFDRIKALARRGDDVRQAAAALGWSSERLVKLLRERKTAARAWDRGALLYHVGRLADIPATVSEAAGDLGMEVDAFRNLLESDPEVGGVWKRSQLRRRRRVMAALWRAAKDGGLGAAKTILARLEDVGEPESRVDPQAVRPQEVLAFLPVSKQTLYQWKRGGAPCNSDGSFSVPDLWKWDRERCKASGGSGGSDTDEALKRERLEKLRLENSATRGELIPRERVMGTLLAYARIVSTLFRRKARQWSKLCKGLSSEQIHAILAPEMDSALREMIDQPRDMKLTDGESERFRQLLNDIAERHRQEDGK
jgi:phage terminase Nu1 subunit (DNA packaging protein)